MIEAAGVVGIPKYVIASNPRILKEADENLYNHYDS